uniref:Dynactin subunit 2 n=1 Tax=Syphacia muris TaxID=451379 RepID=A0A0N5AGZ7_9BILA
MSIQKEDVYETEDLPEVDQPIAQEETYESEDVEKIHIDVDNALKRFQGRLLNADNVDFSDSIARRRRAGYGSGAYVLEVVGNECGEPENIEQKFNRLNYELNDLLEAIQKEDEEKKKETQTAKKVAVDESRYLKLEERLRRIETFVGTDAADDFSHTDTRVPFGEVIEELRLRVRALNPANADVICGRLNKLLAKMQEVNERRKEKIDSEFEKKVDSLYNLILKWDEICTNLPSVVQRICDLHKLHEQAQLFNKNLSELIGVRSQLLKLMDSERVTVVDFKQQMADAISRISMNIEKLQNRLQKLSA